MSTTRLFTLFVCLLTLNSIAFAGIDSPVGLWKTIDDSTHKPRSLVRISEQNGVLSGTIEKDLNPNESPDKVCDKCTDSRKDKTLVSMTIMQGMHQSGEVFEGGEILDPDNGKTYKCKMKLLDDGKKLEVRGFIGVSLFGRSQTWLREE